MKRRMKRGNGEASLAHISRTTPTCLLSHFCVERCARFLNILRNALPQLSKTVTGASTLKFDAASLHTSVIRIGTQLCKRGNILTNLRPQRFKKAIARTRFAVFVWGMRIESHGQKWKCKK